MEDLKEVEQLRQYLTEAVEMLGDLKPKLALFEKQRYFKLKASVDNYLSLNNDLRTSLARITGTK